MDKLNATEVFLIENIVAASASKAKVCKLTSIAHTTITPSRSYGEWVFAQKMD